MLDIVSIPSYHLNLEGRVRLRERELSVLLGQRLQIRYQNVFLCFTVLHTVCLSYVFHFKLFFRLLNYLNQLFSLSCLIIIFFCFDCLFSLTSLLPNMFCVSFIPDFFFHFKADLTRTLFHKISDLIREANWNEIISFESRRKRNIRICVLVVREALGPKDKNANKDSKGVQYEEVKIASGVLF